MHQQARAQAAACACPLRWAAASARTSASLLTAMPLASAARSSAPALLPGSRSSAPCSHSSRRSASDSLSEPGGREGVQGSRRLRCHGTSWGCCRQPGEGGELKTAQCPVASLTELARAADLEAGAGQHPPGGRAGSAALTRGRQASRMGGGRRDSASTAARRLPAPRAVPVRSSRWTCVGGPRGAGCVLPSILLRVLKQSTY